jgi:hypothetical protein
VQSGPRTHEAATGVVVISDATRDPSPADASEPAIRFAARGQPTADRSDDHLVLEATTPRRERITALIRVADADGVRSKLTPTGCCCIPPEAVVSDGGEAACQSAESSWIRKSARV